ncbi:PEP/pyruvate-binding domain-containing protein [Cellulomonas sp. URHB0016]
MTRGEGEPVSITLAQGEPARITRGQREPVPLTRGEGEPVPITVVPLAEADARAGAKAAHLGTLLRAGCPVPPGVVVLDPLGDDAWERTIGGALSRLGTGPFAVRSSAHGEDGARASFAGQLTTALGVDASDVVQAVRRSAASGGSERVAAYAARTGRPVPSVGAVLVQVMVRPDCAGVMFTRNPTTGADEVVVEAVRGLGDGLADGTVTPESSVVAGGHLRSAGTVLTAVQVRELAAVGRRIETMLGGPQDVEWAISGKVTWILQSRPVTTGRPSVLGDAPTGAPLATGVAAGPGTAVGAARVVTGLDDAASFRPGEVLVCRTTSPAWTPLLARAAAVVTETGAMLCHAAIVAREFGIPAVVAAKGATTVLRGRVVAVDGARGVVTAADHQ